MKRFVVGLAAVVVLAVGSGRVSAGLLVLASGNDITPDVAAALAPRGITLNIVDPSAFAGQSFAGYDGIWLGWNSTFPGLDTRKTDLTNFLMAGGRVLAESGLAGNPLSDYPFGEELNAVTNHADNVHIVSPFSPYNLGLTDAGLSNWGESHHALFTDTGTWLPLTIDPDFGDAVTIAREAGFGSILFTGQDPEYHIIHGFGDTGPGSPKADLIVNAFTLGGVLTSPSPEPGSMTLAGLGIAGLLGWTWRRRQKRTA
jgi:PEP-CTERM motif